MRQKKNACQPLLFLNKNIATYDFMINHKYKQHGKKQ